MKSRKVDAMLLAGGLLLGWELLHRAAGGNVVSSPLETIERAVELVQTRVFWGHAASTGVAFGLASILSIAGGVVLGLWLGLRRFAGDVADPVLGTVYSIPKITLYPVILLIFGLGLSAKVAFGVIHGVLPIAIFTMNAVRNVAPVYRRTALMLRLSAADTLTTVLAPAAFPEILAGVRIGIAVTLLGTLIGELFASTSGIGVALIRATELHKVVDILALTMLLFLFAAAVNGSLGFLERQIRHNE
jgi:NitT/TauT family transport system permease protein